MSVDIWPPSQVVTPLSSSRFFFFLYLFERDRKIPNCSPNVTLRGRCLYQSRAPLKALCTFPTERQSHTTITTSTTANSQYLRAVYIYRHNRPFQLRPLNLAFQIIKTKPKCQAKSTTVFPFIALSLGGLSSSLRLLARCPKALGLTREPTFQHG